MLAGHDLWQAADALVAEFGPTAPNYAAARAEILLGEGAHAKAIVYRRIADACQTLLSQSAAGRRAGGTP